MAVVMRDRWTDERLDDLNGKVDDGFKRMDDRFDRLEEKLDRRFEAVDRRFEAVDRRFELMDQRFDSVMTSMFHGGILFASAMVAGFVALAVAAL